MLTIELPISKSIANRLLVRTFLRGGDLSIVPLLHACDDVVLLHGILQADAEQLARHAHLTGTRDIANCGTAMRFLTAVYACMPHTDVILTGTERMQQRPIGGLVKALQHIGADITYMEEEGFPPLRIRGKVLQGGEVTLNQPESTQYVSALLLVSDSTEEGICVQTDCRSPYISMTEQVIAQGEHVCIERDWSAAAFWYEYVALHTGQAVFLPGLSMHALQGDKCAATVFSLLGVKTEERADGIRIEYPSGTTMPDCLTWDFADCPDLYPAVYITCRQLGVKTRFSGLERLPWKESDRLHAFDQLDIIKKGEVCKAYSDHRVAMALIVAGYEVDDTACIAKSYPNFLAQWMKCKEIG